MVAKVTDSHVFLHVVVIEIFFHPTNIAPVKVPLVVPVGETASSNIRSLSHLQSFSANRKSVSTLSPLHFLPSAISKNVENGVGHSTLEPDYAVISALKKIFKS